MASSRFSLGLGRGVTLAVLFLLYLPFLHGQTSYNANILPLGEKEALMGNTGTAGVNSTGAVFYNPAALADLKGHSFSLSGSAYMQYNFKAKPVASFLGTPIDYSANGYQSVPTSVIMVRNYGEWHLGFSILVPMSFEFEGQKDWTIPLDPSSFQLKLLQNYQERLFMAGLSVAHKFGENWSWGISAYAQSFSLSSTIDFRGTFDGDDTSIAQTTTREQRNPINLLVFAGLQRSWDRWNVGLRIALPSLHLFGKGAYYSFSFSNFNGVGLTTENIDLTELDTYFRTPMDIRVGGSFRADENWLVVTDFSYSFSSKYEVYDTDVFESEDNYKGNYRLSLGTEYQLKNNLGLYGGLSFTPSVVDREETIGQDFWSFSTGIKTFSDHLESSFGFFYSLGKGSGELPFGQGRSNQSYQFIGLFLGANYVF